MKIQNLEKHHYDEVSAIYKEGIDTGMATFETQVPNWNDWDKKFLPQCRFVGIIDEKVVAWCALSRASTRPVYQGVAESTIYVASQFRGKGIGKKLLNYLIRSSEENGFWTLQANLFPENVSSLMLHEKCGYRIVGTREKIGALNGRWYDNILLEKRSNKQMETTNILVLCTGNSCRSQIAHGYLNQLTKNEPNIHIYSAGIETHGLNQLAVKTMKEDGIDISHNTSNLFDEYKNVNFDYIITVCDHANENCPYVPSKNAKRLHHNFLDPSKINGTNEEIRDAFIRCREEIKKYCYGFALNELKLKV